MTEQRPSNSLSKAELGANRSIAQQIFIDILARGSPASW